MDDYATFLARKSQLTVQSGFEPLWFPDCLFPFQRSLTEWAIRKGQAAIFASCGLGKSPMYLVWAQNVVMHTNRPVLVLTSLGDTAQALQEAIKFGVEVVRSKDGKFPSGARVVVTNYERLHYFNSADFGGAVANESSILKSFKGKTKAAVTEFLRRLPYRLLATATAAPNDYVELGTSSEALGDLGYQDMITRFFVKKLADRGPNRRCREQYRMKGHAERDFWRWVCSWARACRKPSDVGPFDDSRFVLPELVTHQHVVSAREKRCGFLFDMPAINMEEQREELRRTLHERCEKVAELISAHNNPAVAWCSLNDESKLLARLIPGAVELSGANSDDEKEEMLLAFASCQAPRLVTKPKIAGFGLNWQHCAHMTFFVSYSWEQWHQAIRRCWRFGQTRKVTADMVSTDGMATVLATLERKEEKVERMFSRLVDLMSHSMMIGRTADRTGKTEVPSWLRSNTN